MACIYEEFLMMLEIISCAMKHYMSLNEKKRQMFACTLYFYCINAYPKISMLSKDELCMFVLLLLFVISTLGTYFLKNCKKKFFNYALYSFILMSLLCLSLLWRSTNKPKNSSLHEDHKFPKSLSLFFCNAECLEKLKTICEMTNCMYD